MDGFAWIVLWSMLLLTGYKGNSLEAPELTNIDKKGEFSYGLAEKEIFAATHLPEAHCTSVLQLQEQITGQIFLSHSNIKLIYLELEH